MTRGSYLTVCYNRFGLTIIWAPFGTMHIERFRPSCEKPSADAIYKAVKECMRNHGIRRGKNFVLINEIENAEIKAGFNERWYK